MGGPKKPKAWSGVVEAPRARGWREESEALREILLGCGLEEHIKWGSRCYAFGGKNVAIAQHMKAFLALMFFKGALLEDPEGVLKRPGESSNAGRRLELSLVQHIVESRAIIRGFVRQAIAIEKAGLKVKPPASLVFPPELEAKFKREPIFKAAFEALTPGRQRGYNIYFSAPKGAEARERRIDKYAPKILAGKGFHDR